MRIYSRVPVEQRFWRYVDASGGALACWPWTGTRIPTGYGQIWDGEKGGHVSATHVALRLAGRPLADGEVACHTCDNPPCVNPAHLFAGTARDNAEDMLAKGRWRKGRRDPEAIGRRVANDWASYTPEQRLNRINAARRGRGLEPRGLSPARLYGTCPVTVEDPAP